MKSIPSKLKHLPSVVDAHLDMHYRIGMRVVKTAAAVMVCLVIALLTGGGMAAVTITAVSAIVTIRPTHGDTVHTGVFRLIGTLFGGLIGILTVIIGLFLPYYYDGLFIIVIPLMLMLNLYICNVLKMQDSCSVSCVVTLLVAANMSYDAAVGESLIYTLFRLRDTFIGVAVATVMNIIPYRVLGSLFKKK